MWQPSKLTQEQIEERRLAGGRLLRAGQLSKAEIARQLGVSRSAVSQWAQQMKQRRRGLRGLQRVKPRGGRPYLTPAQWRKVLRDLERGAQAFGYEDERWTLGRMQQLIVQRYGVSYNTNYLSEKLHKLGWSLQQPLRAARERAEALVADWLKQHWPRIKKRPGAAKL
jgi:transposase